jgi:putative endonuclease
MCASNWSVYLIETSCGKLYTGISTDVERRFQEHLAVFAGLSNQGAKYFRGREPVKVVHVEPFGSRSAASKREYAVKKMSALQKRALFN